MLNNLFNKPLEPSQPLELTIDLLSEQVLNVFEQETEKRIHYLQSADPDPYGLHKIPIETRLVYMEHYLITGNYLI